MPTTRKGGSSTSDTGAAILLRDGWQQCEARAQQTEKLYRKSEREFLRLVLRIMGETRDIDLKLSQVECKFTRRQHDNLQSKCQALTSLLQAGIHPEIAIATSGLFNDPMDVYSQSKKYLDKWEPITMLANEMLLNGNVPMEPTAEETTTTTATEETTTESESDSQ